MDVPVCWFMEEFVRLLLVRSSATLAQTTGDSTVGPVHVCRGDNTAEQIANGPVPQIQEQKVEVIKVILQEQCQRMRFFFFFERESVWRGGCGLHGKSVLPHSLSHMRSLILSASDGIWNMLFSTSSHTSHWVRFGGHFRHMCECSLTQSTFCTDALVSSSVG